MKNFTSWAVCALALGATACSGNSLEGGSSQNDGGAQAASSPSSIPSTPLTGTVNGAPFEPKSVEVRRDGERWFFSVRNYTSNCGVSSGSTASLGPELSLITIAAIAAKVGTESIAYGDSHGATFQTGVYEKDKGTPIAKSATNGSLRFDTWTDVPGETITGGLKLQGDDSEVAGTFTATVCPPRG